VQVYHIKKNEAATLSCAVGLTGVYKLYQYMLYKHMVKKMSAGSAQVGRFLVYKSMDDTPDTCYELSIHRMTDNWVAETPVSGLQRTEIGFAARNCRACRRKPINFSGE
jgi:hypothetical protein